MAHTDCDFGALTLEQLIGMTVAKNDTTNVYYIRTVQVEVDCGDLVDVHECGTQFNLETLLRKAIVIDDCSGKPAFNLAICTCED